MPFARGVYSQYGVAVSVDTTPQHGSLAAVTRLHYDSLPGTGDVYIYRGPADPRDTEGVDSWPLVATVSDEVDGSGNYDEFGHSISISSAGVLLVGAPFHDGAAGSSSGRAFVFAAAPSDDSQWTPVQLQPTGLMPSDRFGYNVAVEASLALGGVAVVGTPKRDVGADNNAGSVWVFAAAPTGGDATTWTWVEVAELTADVPVAEEQMGRAVALSGGFIAAAGPRGSSTGSVTVFQASDMADPPASTWMQVASLSPPSGDAGGVGTLHFGADVSLSSDSSIVAIGAYGDTSYGEDSGAVYLYSLTTFELVVKLTASDSRALVRFGSSVALHQSTLIVGTPRDILETGGNVRGSVYLYEAQGNPQTADSWVQVSKIGGDAYVAPGIPSFADAKFGDEVAIASNVAMAGAKGDNQAFFMFASKGVTVPGTELQEPAAAGAQLGTTTAISDAGDIMVTGAPTGGVGGQAFVYGCASHPPTTACWQQLSELVPTTTPAIEDKFGGAVATNVGIAVVGAPGNGVGYVTVFAAPNVVEPAYTPGSWTPVATLASSDGVAGDEFGAAVAMRDNVIVVGAPNHATHGAVYVFEPDTPQDLATASWTLLARFASASTGSSPARFGAAVDVMLPMIAVGSPLFNDMGAVHLFEQASTNAGGNGDPYGGGGDPYGGGGDPYGGGGDPYGGGGDPYGGGGDPYGGGGDPNAGGGGDPNLPAFDELTELQAIDKAANDQLGASVAFLSSKQLVAGAPLDDDAGVCVCSAFAAVRFHDVDRVLCFVLDAGLDSGSLYVFSLVDMPNGAPQWVQSAQKMGEPSIGQFASLGKSVAAYGGTIVAGAPGTTATRGAVVVFTAVDPMSPTTSSWTRSAVMTQPPTDTSLAGNFGTSVAVAGSIVAVGAPTVAGVTDGKLVLAELHDGAMATVTANMATAIQQIGCVRTLAYTPLGACPAVFVKPSPLAAPDSLMVRNEDLWDAGKGWEIRSRLHLVGDPAARPTMGAQQLNFRDVSWSAHHIDFTGYADVQPKDGGMFQITPGVASVSAVDVVLHNCRVFFGEGRRGGAIHVSGATLIITRTEFIECSAALGGAIFAEQVGRHVHRWIGSRSLTIVHASAAGC